MKKLIVVLALIAGCGGSEEPLPVEPCTLKRVCDGRTASEVCAETWSHPVGRACADCHVAHRPECGPAMLLCNCPP